MNFVFNVALGKVGLYAANVLNNTPTACCLTVVPLETNGLESDANLRKHTTLASLLAGSSNEQTTAGRKQVNQTGITITVDDTGNKLTVKVPDQTWAAVPAGNQVAAFVWCYQVDEAVVNDGTTIPLSKHDRLWTPDGTPFTLSGPSGFYEAAAAAA